MKRPKDKDIMLFSIPKEKVIKFNDWNNKHKEKCPLYMKDGAIGGRLTFTFTPTGLGEIVKVKCACGEELDLTDYEGW